MTEKPMFTGKLCIICSARKPESQFEKKGEHIVPRFLGSRRLRTPFVCRDCNNGFGGSVDLALKNSLDAALACFDRGVAGARESVLKLKNHYTENPDIKGAILKIVYETAHLRLGNNWLDDPIAAAIRNVLSAYVNKDRKTARALMDDIRIRHIPAGIFYFSIDTQRSALVKRAIIGKSCLNALWLFPLEILPGESGASIAIACDIEGLPFGYVIVSESDWDVTAPELLAPRIK